MKKLFMLVALLLFLSSCSKNEENEKETRDMSSNVVNVYNWGEYIDKDVLDEFEEETGIKVRYDNFVTNEDLYVKMKKGGDSYDVVIPSEYMIEKMIKEGLLQKLDMAKIEGIENIDPNLRGLSYDPNSEYSVPYFWGTLGVVYNKEIIGEDIKSWSDLWDDKFKGEVIMLDSSRDTIGIGLVKNGFSMNSLNKDELEIAKKDLIKQKKNILAYQVDETKSYIVGEEVGAAVMYSGDALDAVRENEKLQYVVPEEGSNIWLDAMVIPLNAKNVENAHKFISFILRPDIAAKIADYVGYATANLKARELLPEEMKESEIAYPDFKKLPKLEMFSDPGKFIEIYDDIWTDIISE